LVEISTLVRLRDLKFDILNLKFGIRQPKTCLPITYNLSLVLIDQRKSGPLGTALNFKFKTSNLPVGRQV
jgi:hypothetical protein